jgi:hypothetical protein
MIITQFVNYGVLEKNILISWIFMEFNFNGLNSFLWDIFQDLILIEKSNSENQILIFLILKIFSNAFFDFEKDESSNEDLKFLLLFFMKLNSDFFIKNHQSLINFFNENDVHIFLVESSKFFCEQ